MSGGEFSQLTALVTTTGDLRGLQRLLASRDRFAPTLRVMAATFGEAPSLEGVQWVKTPERSLAAQRNALLARVRTPMFALLDDRQELCAQSQLTELAAAVASDRYDLAAGSLVHCGRKWLLFTQRDVRQEHGRFVIDGDAVRAQALSLAGEGAWRDVDLASGFFVARAESVRNMGGWEPKTSPLRHDEFYWRARNYEVRVGFHAAAQLWDWSPQDAVSSPGEERSLGELMGVTLYVDLAGQQHVGRRMAAAA